MRTFVNRLLPSSRTIKAVPAAVVSWLIANRLRSKHPFFAPLAAILCLQVTVEKSIRLGFQRILGILVGIGAAIAIAVNITVIPPDFSRSTEKLLHKAASDLATYYRQYSKWFREGAPESTAEDIRSSFTALAQDLNNTSSKLEQAMHALKFSPFTRRRRKRLEYLRLLLNMRKKPRP